MQGIPLPLLLSFSILKPMLIPILILILILIFIPIPIFILILIQEGTDQFPELQIPHLIVMYSYPIADIICTASYFMATPPRHLHASRIQIYCSLA
ncbi:hypothetical protein BZA77DRAFT_311102 [Pyronema omphalodes]|nr:hypothetical protein BZA77DRAFT_311102 [Pyronema omphalodes]